MTAFGQLYDSFMTVDIAVCVCVCLCGLISIASINLHISSLPLSPESISPSFSQVTLSLMRDAPLPVLPNLTSTIPCSIVPEGKLFLGNDDGGPSPAGSSLAVCAPAVHGQRLCEMRSKGDLCLYTGGRRREE